MISFYWRDLHHATSNQQYLTLTCDQVSRILLEISDSKDNSRIAAKENNRPRARFQPFRYPTLNGTTRCWCSGAISWYSDSRKHCGTWQQLNFSTDIKSGSERNPSLSTSCTKSSKLSGSTRPLVPKSARQLNIHGLATPASSKLVM